MEAGCPGRQADSFAEITVPVTGPTSLNALTNSRMACDSEGTLEGIPFTHTDIASDSRMSSPLTGLPWFHDIIWIAASHLVS